MQVKLTELPSIQNQFIATFIPVDDSGNALPNTESITLNRRNYLGNIKLNQIITFESITR